MTTAYAFASDKDRIMENGFNGYVSKPVNANKLKSELTASAKYFFDFSEAVVQAYLFYVAFVVAVYDHAYLVDTGRKSPRASSCATDRLRRLSNSPS